MEDEPEQNNAQNLLDSREKKKASRKRTQKSKLQQKCEK